MEIPEEYADWSAVPRLGDVAPDFDAITTHGPLKLSSLHDQWVVLFSYLADFHPVAASEFVRFAELFPEFRRRTCQVVALGCDSLPSHLAWVRDLEAQFGTRIPFQVIADTEGRVSRMYGLSRSTIGEVGAVSATLVLDPQRVLRAQILYPPSVGRSVNEVLRLLQALQACDVESVDTPADWQPGETTLVPVPRTQESAERRMEEEPDSKTWYFSQRSLG